MPSRETVEAFVASVEAGEFVEAMERFYDENATAQENCEPARVGRPALIENERRVLATFTDVRGRSGGPVFIEGDDVVINWQFEMRHPSGAALHLDELVHQTWCGEKLVRERFFYDPQQLQV